MAEDVDFILKFRDAFSSAFDKAGKGLDGLTEKTNKLGGAMGGLDGILDTVLSGFAIEEFGKKIFEAGTYMEQLHVAFETMVGDKDKGDQLVREIQNFALVTPFQIQQVADAGKQLLAFGISARKIIPDLRMLGDITAGIGTDKMPQLVHAFGQMHASINLNGYELREFSMAGVPLIKALADTMHVSQSAIKEMATEGKIGFKDVEIALKSLTDEGGRFHDLMQKQSETTGGKWSNMADQITKSAAIAFDNWKPVIDYLIDGFAKLVFWSGKFMSGRAWMTAQGRMQTSMERNAQFQNNTQDQKWLTAGYDANQYNDKDEAVGALINMDKVKSENDKMYQSALGNKNQKEALDKFSEKTSELIETIDKSYTNDNEKMVLKNLLKENLDQADEKLHPEAEEAMGKAGKSKGGKHTEYLGSGVAGVSSIAPKNFYISIENLVKELIVSAKDLPESAQKVRTELAKALLTAVNDVNLIGH